MIPPYNEIRQFNGLLAIIARRPATPQMAEPTIFPRSLIKNNQNKGMLAFNY